MKKSNYITELGHKRLLDEQEYLIRTERPEITKIVQWAASLGDRSENADYLYGKRRLREIDRRLRLLAKKIDDALVVNPLQIVSEKVQFGATVFLMDEKEIKKNYSIVGVDEIDLKRNLISWRSPIASALMGKSIGDMAEIKSPDKIYEVEIIHIEYKHIDIEAFIAKK
jgi:transcription elongation factor GreB